MSGNRNQAGTIAGGTIAVFSGAAIMFAMVTQVEGFLVFVAGTAGLLTLVGATLLLLSLFTD